MIVGQVLSCLNIYFKLLLVVVAVNYTWKEFFMAGHQKHEEINRDAMEREKER